MSMLETYRDYFDIDPDYLSAVNEAVINSNPEMWKKFFPHETFVKLLKNTIDVLNRKQKLSVWVEGPYGTGKSHAVLTLKKLLECSEEDTYAYFKRYNLSHDICNSLMNIKDDGKILTVHRYGSSGIHGDNDLVLAIQESIEKSNYVSMLKRLLNSMVSKTKLRTLSKTLSLNIIPTLKINRASTFMLQAVILTCSAEMI